MKAIKAVKKMVALGMGLSMVGATIMGASASLSQFPAPFVQAGQVNGVMVVGAQAATIDTIAAVDLQGALVGRAAGGSGVVVQGEGMLIEEGGDELENEERLNAVLEVADEDDMSNVLAGGRFRNQKGSFDYDEYLNVGNGSVQHTVDDDDDDSKVATYLVFEDGTLLYEYRFTATQQLESDVDADDFLEDFEQKSMTMLGKTWKIVRATRVANNSIELELISGDITDTVLEGEEKTYQLPSGRSVVVKNVLIADRSETGSDVRTKWIVDGESVDDTLEEGDTYTTASGITIALLTVLANEGTEEGGSDLAEIALTEGQGSKATLTDTDMTNDLSSHEIEIDEEDIDDVDVVIKGTISETEARISEIKIRALSQDDAFVPAGSRLSETLEEPEQLFGGIDYLFVGPQEASTEQFNIRQKSNNQLALDAVLRDGPLSNLEVWNSPSGTTVALGDESAGETLHVVESANSTTYNIARDDRFVVTSGTTTVVFQYRSYDADTGTLTLKNEITGDNAEFVVSGGTTTVIAGGKEWVVNVEDDSVDDSDITVDLNDDGSFNAATVTWFTRSEHEFVINTTSLLLTQDDDSFDDFLDANAATETVQFDFTATSGELNDASITYGNVASLFDGSFLTSMSDQDDDRQGVTIGGIVVDENDNDDDFNDLSAMMPSEQTIQQVVFGVGTLTATGGSASSGGQVSVEAARLDSEVGNPQTFGRNLIVVGGPCANTVAAALLGNPENCAEGFQAGRARISLFDLDGGNTALLVAGFSGDDTRAAAGAIADGKLSGSPGNDALFTRSSNTFETVTPSASSTGTI